MLSEAVKIFDEKCRNETLSADTIFVDSQVVLKGIQLGTPGPGQVLALPLL